MIPLLSTSGQKAIQLLNLPPEYVDNHTPYFVDASESFPDQASVVTWCDFRNGGVEGDEDSWDRLKVVDIPLIAFHEALEKLQPGTEVPTDVEGKVITIDRRWGSHCLDSYVREEGEKVDLRIELGISEDTKIVILKMYRRRPAGHGLCAQLNNSEK